MQREEYTGDFQVWDKYGDIYPLQPCYRIEMSRYGWLTRAVQNPYLGWGLRDPADVIPGRTKSEPGTQLQE